MRRLSLQYLHMSTVKVVEERPGDLPLHEDKVAEATAELMLKPLH